MIELVRPRSFIPLHGTRHHLDRHTALAQSLGIADAMVLENGDVGVLEGAGATLRVDGRWPSGRVHLAFSGAVSGETLEGAAGARSPPKWVVFAASPVLAGSSRGTCSWFRAG